MDTDRDAGPLGRLPHQGLDGGLEAELVEDAGSQLAGDAAHDLHRLVDTVAERHLAHAEDAGIAGAAVLGPGDVELQGGERLAQLVVNLPRDPGAFLLTRLLEPGREGPQLGPRLFQFLRGLHAVAHVPLNPEVPGDAAGGIVEAHVVAFDPHRRAVEPALVREAVRVPGVEQLAPAAAAGREVVAGEITRRHAAQLRRRGAARPSLRPTRTGHDKLGQAVV